MSVRALSVAAAVVVLAGAFEIGWRVTFGVPSPALGLLFAFAAISVGRASLTLSRGSERTNIGSTEAFLIGAVGLTLLYAVFAFAHSTRAFPFAAWMVSLASVPLAIRGRPFRGKVKPSAIAIGAAVFLIALRNAYIVDRLDLTVREPSGFAWIDTPLWYSIAYGVERGIPAPDLLFSGGQLNYHFGCGLVINTVRGMTGLPMQTAYFATLLGFSISLSAILFVTARAFLRAPPVAAFAAALLSAIMFADFGRNVASVIAVPVFFALVLQLRRCRRPASVPVIVLGMLFFIMTKEVQYVLFVAGGGLLAAFLLWKKRRFAPLIALAIGFVATRPLDDVLIRIDQKSHLLPFTEHFARGFLRTSFERESVWFAAGIFALAVASALRHRAIRFVVVVGSAVVIYFMCEALSWFVKPDFEPPMDAFSYGWILYDMGQFERSGRLLILVTVVVVGATVLFRFGPIRRERIAPVSAALILSLIGYDIVNYWAFAPASTWGKYYEPRPVDPVVPLLARIPTTGTVIAADQFNWNDENPYWAAYFGHQFYVLRRGRWTTAYKNYRERLDSQRILFTTDDAGAARDIVKRDGITHIIESRARPIPWLRGHEPLAANDAYSVYDATAD